MGSSHERGQKMSSKFGRQLGFSSPRCSPSYVTSWLSPTLLSLSRTPSGPRPGPSARPYLQGTRSQLRNAAERSAAQHMFCGGSVSCLACGCVAPPGWQAMPGPLPHASLTLLLIEQAVLSRQRLTGPKMSNTKVGWWQAQSALVYGYPPALCPCVCGANCSSRDFLDLQARWTWSQRQTRSVRS